MGKLAAIIVGLSAATFIGSTGLNLSALGLAIPARNGMPESDCDIKGNVSYNKGQRIYHMPGQEDYDETRISPNRGEQWFCSEAEARAAGWQKATR